MILQLDQSRVSFSLPRPTQVEWISSTICWAIYIALMIGYCTVYDVYVHGTGPRLSEALLWGVREWGLWLVLAPMIMRTLGRTSETRPLFLRDFFFILVVSVGFALIFRVGLDRVLQESASVWVSIIMHTPRYLFGCLGVFLIWVLLTRSGYLGKPEQAERNEVAGGHAHDFRPLQPCSPKPTKLHAADRIRANKNIVVYSGTEEKTISIDSIVVATAARNYVELRCNSNAVYIIRSTLRKLEEKLSSDFFVRTHRSNIVNVSHIDGVKRRPSGSGLVQLKGGIEVSVSKRYMPQTIAVSNK